MLDSEDFRDELSLFIRWIKEDLAVVPEPSFKMRRATQL